MAGQTRRVLTAPKLAYGQAVIRKPDVLECQCPGQLGTLGPSTQYKSNAWCQGPQNRDPDPYPWSESQKNKPVHDAHRSSICMGYKDMEVSASSTSMGNEHA